ncbi:MAG: Arylsulfatase [Verrucomicrobiota bacterium]|jgi:hypothetical protein
MNNSPTILRAQSICRACRLEVGRVKPAAPTMNWPSSLPRVVAVGLFVALLTGALAQTARTVLKPHPAAVPNTHAPSEVDRPELVPFIVADPAKLPGIVVDETAATLVGQWQYSTHTPPYVGLGYLHDQNAGKGAKSVTFTPDLPRAGHYEVRLAHCYNVRRATNTPVTIHHADGKTKLRLNQQAEPAHGRLFRTLGTFRFAAGTNGWVRLSNEGTEGKYVIADAVQFLPVP